MMIVDKATGILMKFESYKNGKVSGFITVTKCVIDGDTKIKRFDKNKYSAFTEE